VHKYIYTNKDTNRFFWCLGAVRFAREKQATVHRLQNLLERALHFAATLSEHAAYYEKAQTAKTASA
jgi:hypothetical protein